LRLKDNPSPDPAQCGKPTALGTPFLEVDSLEAILMMHDSQGINADGPMLCVYILDSLEAIHMMHDSQGINADGPMLCVYILDSASPEHCTGDRSQLSDYHPEVRPDRYLRGAGGTLMRVHGTGSIRNENFQVKGVLYIPGLNNQPNINKTIFSVAKLNELGYNVLFNSDGSSTVIDNSKGTWNLKHEIIGKAQKKYGHFLLDYLRIPLNRDPVPMLEGRGLLKSLWNASRSVWSSITGHLSQRTTCAQRPPV